MGALDGYAAIVTGASRGIGKGCALELGAAGATVYATGRTRKEGDAPLPGSLEATVREVEAQGGRAVGVQQVPNLEQVFDISGAETPRFCGRAVAALAADSDVLRHTGRAVAARELAEEYGFTDVDGRLPKGPMSHDERADAAGRD